MEDQKSQDFICGREASNSDGVGGGLTVHACGVHVQLENMPTSQINLPDDVTDGCQS
jgi:hypothetical protein